MPRELDVLTSAGIVFIVIGILFILIPLVARYIPSKDIVERVPWIILYVYRQDGFTFITSPILILISLVYLLYILLRWM